MIFNYILDWFISITLLFLIFSNQTTRKLVSSSIMSHKHESVHHLPRIHVSQQGYYHCLLILKHMYYYFDWPLTFIQQGCSLEFSCFLVSVWIVSYGAFILKSQSLIPIDWETPGWTSAAGTLPHQNSGFSVGFYLPWLSDLSRCRGQRWLQYLINCLRSSWHICSVFLWKAVLHFWKCLVYTMGQWLLWESWVKCVCCTEERFHESVFDSLSTTVNCQTWSFSPVPH